ncbi:acetylornithine aminotransferase [Syntrophus gentianae]|uniref:Acetylornithine aminotransferase n=1 Tax=Syntrophus gentianae TaxID=43775 RepID=A0A1H7W2C8_9BACT|nr:acetylornithine transaminase [Syntrophus gentianae]SEM15167.1 acetylornithine aminotransferase [Syntrophus gentianae]
MTTEEMIALSEKTIMGTYRRFPVVMTRGEGVRVWDSNGKEYLDFVAGIAVCILGHCHPAVVEAIKRQAEILMHVSNLYYIEPQISFASQLVEHSFADKVFFCNSGAEANEGAIKLARRYAFEHMAPERRELITMTDSFHGRTLATISATGQKKFQVGFDPLPGGFKYVPFNDITALEGALTERTCGVLLEPIQGEGGVRVPDDDYLRKVRSLCNEKGILMILDEVQVGMGRTGHLFAYEHDSVTPDIMTLAKGLGNGFPMGAVLATEKVASAFVPGTHASTFGGNPLAMAAGLAVLDTLLKTDVLENCRRQGAYLQECLTKLKEKYPFVREIRGRGLIQGMELTIQGSDIVRSCMEKGLLINCTNENVLRFVPPLILSKSDIDRAVEILGKAMGEQ